MSDSINADEVVRLLGLEAHPEGGYYRETFRDSRQAGERSVSTAIYFLLKQGEIRAGIGSMLSRCGTGTVARRSGYRFETMKIRPRRFCW